MTNDATPGSRLAELWALAGISILFAFAVFRLGVRGLAISFADLSWIEWVALAASIAFFVYGEGVLALQRRWVPRVLGRARDLLTESNFAFRAFAPLYAMSMIGATPRRLAGGWGLFLGVVTLAVWVQRLPSPWRGIVDLGVAGALAWGLVFLVAGALRSGSPRPPPDSPSSHRS